MNARKNTRCALYLRVSTSRQETENQRLELTEIAERAGWPIVEVYEDKGISGAKGRKDRPALDEMLKDAARRKFKMLLVWDLTRLGRSLRDLLEIAKTLESCGVDLFVFKDGYDTSTPSGRLFFHIVGSLAEFERERIKERVTAGIARAKAQGTKSGKPIGRPVKLTPSKKRKIAELRAKKLSYRKIAAEVGLSFDTVRRALQE